MSLEVSRSHILLQFKSCVLVTKLHFRRLLESILRIVPSRYLSSATSVIKLIMGDHRGMKAHQINLDDFKAPKLLPARAEMRSLEFWKSVISECMATFFYVFIVCGAAAGAATNGTAAQTIFAAAAASGFSMSALVQCFAHASGAHINPSVSIAMALTRNISPFKAMMFVAAQCGGGIAGAALLYGVSVPGHYGSMNATLAQLPAHLTPWERFCIEFVLTCVVVFAYFVSMNSSNTWFGTTSCLGSAYFACGLVSMPSLNPARSLGPSFVMNRWDNHWVLWAGPIVGGCIAGMLYECIFSKQKSMKLCSDVLEVDSSSVNDDEEDYEERRRMSMKPYGAHMDSMAGPSILRAAMDPNEIASLYATAAPSYKLHRAESLYGGTKSMHTLSPQLTRANLKRSQSVYTKPPSLSANVLQLPPPLPPPGGPLVPALSLYADLASANQNQANQKRLGSGPGNQNTVANSEEKTQARQRSESIYGRTRRQDSDYETAKTGRNNYPSENPARRPETVDSCYGSMHSEPSTKEPGRNNYSVVKSDSYGMIKSEPNPAYGVVKSENRNSPSNFIESRRSPSYTIMKPANDTQTYVVKPELNKESMYVMKRQERNDSEDHPSTHRAYPKSENSAFKPPPRNESLYARRQELPPSYQETRSNYESMKPHDPSTHMKVMEQELTHHPAHHRSDREFKSYEKPNCDILLKPTDSPDHIVPMRMKPLQYNHNEVPMYPPYGRPEVSPGGGPSRSRESTPTSKELEAINDSRHHHLSQPQQQFYLC